MLCCIPCRAPGGRCSQQGLETPNRAGSCSPAEENPQARAGWAGSPELVKRDSAFCPGGAGTWGPCYVITQPSSPPSGLWAPGGAGLELPNPTGYFSG